MMAVTETRCLEMDDCSWLVTDDPEDCDITTTETTTTTQTPGCCKGTNRNSNDACNAIEDPDQCDRRSSCTFIAFGNIAVDCVFPPTEPPSEPGCCYGNPDIAYSKRWMEQCKKFGTEEECLMLTNGDGEPRCYFEPLGEYEDCETVWPTTTETPTEPAGCCYGDSYKSNDKCRKMDEDRARCEKQGCTFLVSDDPDDCDVTTTSTETPPTTTEELGCCYGEGVKENEMCGNKVGRDQCERSGQCEFRAGADADCTFVPTTTTEEVGCCYGLESICGDRLDSKSCARRPEDCEWRVGEVGPCTIVKDTTTAEPGCCYNPDSYKGNDKCAAMSDDQERCEKQGCTFLVTDDPDDCVFTTTETPTTTEDVGCCMGDSFKTNAMCNNRLTRAQCDRSSSCTFVEDGILEEGDCDFGTTQPPDEPGCCYGNPDIAYSKRWMEQCKDYGTERECLMLEDDDGNKRCTFEPMNEYMDCEAVWPTTTETPAGCCRGDGYKSNDKCRRNDYDQAKCEAQD